MAQRALAQELLCPEGGLSSCYHLALAQLHTLRGEYCSAETSLSAALSDSYEVIQAHSTSQQTHKTWQIDFILDHHTSLDLSFCNSNSTFP